MNRDDEQQPQANNQSQSPLGDNPPTPYSPSEIEPPTGGQSSQDMPDPLEMPQVKENPTGLTSEPVAPVSSVEPSAQPAPTQPQPNPMDDAANGFATITQPQKSKRAKWLLPVIIAAVLVVLGGGGVLAYKFWYQNPNKVISDGLLHAVEAKSFTYTASLKTTSNNQTPYSLTVTGISKDGANSANVDLNLAMSGQNYTIKVGAVVDATGNIYLNASNIHDLAKSYEAQLPPSASAVIDDFLKKVEGEWLKIDSDSIKSFSQDYAKLQQCGQDTLKKIQSDNSYMTELADLYKAHPFYTVTKELGSKDGSLGYQVTPNAQEEKAFGESLKNTKLYKQMHDCDSSFTIDTTDVTDTQNNNATSELWVSQWSHEITKISSTSTIDGATMTVTSSPVFNTSTPVTVPKNPKSIKDFMQEIQDLETSLMQPGPELQPAATTTDSNLL